MTVQENIFETLASLARALGSGPRLAIVVRLAQAEASVEKIADTVGLSIANTSQHLQQLRRAGLVTANRSGKKMIYRLTDERIINLIDLMRNIAETNIAEMERLVSQLFDYGDAEGELLPITTEELCVRLENSEVTLIDVRPEDEYQSGHLSGAVNIPIDKLDGLLDTLPKDTEIVAYCRGPYCALSHSAVQTLLKHGYKVRRFKDGYPEWKAAGLPIAKNVDSMTADL